MTAVAHQPNHTSPEAADPPNLVGDRVQILYVSERGTILADAYVSAVCSPVRAAATASNAVMCDARASFHLVPAEGPAKTIAAAASHRPGHVIYGVDHTKATE